MTQTAGGKLLLAQGAGLGALCGPRGWEGGGREGTCVYTLLIHEVVQQKPTQHCKAIIFQKKRKENCLEGERSTLHSESAMAGPCFLLFEA